MHRRSNPARALALLLAISFVPLHASAYCRTRIGAAEARRRGDPADENGCHGTGAPLYWRSRCISYQIYSQAIRQVSLDEATRVVADAFAKWTQSSCETDDSSADARVSIDVRDLGLTDCGRAGKGRAGEDEVGYNREGPNQNAIVFRDEYWPYQRGDEGPDDQSRTLGLTTVTFTQEGEIGDADIEFNTFDQKVKIRDIGPDDYDLASIVAHEVGHFLGLAHSAELNSTMYFEYEPGETRKQFLKVDDIRGICSVYLPGGLRSVANDQFLEATACNPTPRGGAQRSCDDDGGCSLYAPHETSWSSALTAGGLGFATLTFVRMLRRRRAKHASFETLQR